MDTSESAIFHGLEMSRKSWAYQPGDFWALNNGITIVANNFEEITPKKFKIFQLSIVNGCQSTVSLSRAVHHDKGAERCQILVRVVGAKKALLTDIVRYNNTQNPVKLSAVRLLDPIQEGLRTAFSRIDIQYAPKQEGAKATKSHKRIELDRIAQYLASTSEDTILEAVTKKAELFDRSYKSIFPRGLRPEIVYLAWILAHHIEAERANLLEDTSISGDPQMKAILGIYGTPWGIFVAYNLIIKFGSDLSKLTLEKMATEVFSNSLLKYAKKAMELYSEIAVNILTTSDEALNLRNELRTRTFLEKLRRILACVSPKALLGVSQSSTKLAK
ncbi:AIPR family protein [Xanthomonas citri]|uniref:AIPR family protein n=1 Tax=Xanthomonas citri TaxID=346 RepID=UPI000AC84A02|nr:AIPR family protein [Xanthomonas citri]